ncbi:hypothetical protein H9Q74_006292 [Fusarium xylarioides]|nr:hypothetical protein H9Q71_013606 [Fusarium xylarioides]KAG5823608.1 hypothetical protein H9Q74_006292 [Fusarium xylarioides]
MVSPTIDLEQWKLLQNFALPTSQPAMASLYDKESYLAHGRSKDTAIFIPSDVESDTDDEGDASQLDSSQSYDTRTSTPDYLDLTTIENGATESEANIVGTDIMSAVHSTQAKAATAGPNEPKVAHLAETEPSKQSSCEMNPLLIEDTSACQDVNFVTPPTSPGSQSYPAAADGKQLRPDPTSQQNNMVVDPVSDYDDCHSTQVHQDSLSIGGYYPQTCSPIKESEIPAGKAGGNSIPETPIQSIAGPCHHLHQGQGSDDVINSSIRSESEVIESKSNSEVKEPSTVPSLHHSHHGSLQIHESNQVKVTGAGSEVPGSINGINEPEYQRCKDNSLSPPVNGYSGSEDNDSDDDDGPCKRRKVSKSPSYSARSNTTMSRSSSKRQSATNTAQPPNDIQPSEHEMHKSTPSQATVTPSDASEFLAQFEEWPLENVLLKRITEGSKITF